jgi:hypothetical protein
VYCVVGAVEDWQDMRLVMEDAHAVRDSRRVWWFGPQNHPLLWMPGLCEFRPQNSAAVVLEGTSGGTWLDRQGCVKAKQLRVKDVTIG